MRWALFLLLAAAAAAFGGWSWVERSNADLQASSAEAARAKLDALAAQWERAKTAPAGRAAVLLLLDGRDEAPLARREGVGVELKSAWRRTMTLERRDPELFSEPAVLAVRTERLVKPEDELAQVQALQNLLLTAQSYHARLSAVTRGETALLRLSAAAAATAAQSAGPSRIIALGADRDAVASRLPAAPDGLVIARRAGRGEPVVELRDSAGAWQAAPASTFAGDDPLAAAAALALQPEPIRLYEKPQPQPARVAQAPAAPAGPTPQDLAPRRRAMKGRWKGWLDWSGHRGEFSLDLPKEDDAGRAEGTLVLAGPGGTQSGGVALETDITGGVVTETLPVNPRMKCRGQLRDGDSWIDGACWSPDGTDRRFRLDRQSGK